VVLPRFEIRLKLGYPLDVASLIRVRYRARVLRRGDRSWQIPASSAYRVRYRVYLPDRVVTRARETQQKTMAQVLLREAEGVEALLGRGAATQEDVRRWVRLGLLTRQDAAALLGQDVAASWDELLDRYQERASRLRHRTAQTNLSRARDLVAWFRERCPDPVQLTPALVEEWVRGCVAAGRAANTVNHTLDVLRVLLDPAWPEGNPARAVQRLRAGRQARFPRAMTPEEDEEAIRRAWERRQTLSGLLWPLYLVLRVAGLRLTEARYLPRAHVLPGRILVQEVALAPQEVAGGDLFYRNVWQPKSYEARAVPVPEWLTDYLLSLPAGRLLLAPGARALQRDVAADALRAVLRAVAPDLTPHCLRHTAITALLEEGHPVPWVQAWAGHRDIRTTMRYTHVALVGRPRRTAEIARDLVLTSLGDWRT
jgi:integrase